MPERGPSWGQAGPVLSGEDACPEGRKVTENGKWKFARKSQHDTSAPTPTSCACNNAKYHSYWRVSQFAKRHGA